jgi:hypothetical protein
MDITQKSPFPFDKQQGERTLIDFETQLILVKRLTQFFPLALPAYMA